MSCVQKYSSLVWILFWIFGSSSTLEKDACSSFEGTDKLSRNTRYSGRKVKIRIRCNVTVTIHLVRIESIFNTQSGVSKHRKFWASIFWYQLQIFSRVLDSTLWFWYVFSYSHIYVITNSISSDAGFPSGIRILIFGKLIDDTELPKHANLCKNES